MNAPWSDFHFLFTAKTSSVEETSAVLSVKSSDEFSGLTQVDLSVAVDIDDCSLLLETLSVLASRCPALPVFLLFLRGPLR